MRSSRSGSVVRTTTWPSLLPRSMIGGRGICYSVAACHWWSQLLLASLVEEDKLLHRGSAEWCIPFLAHAPRAQPKVALPVWSYETIDSPFGVQALLLVCSQPLSDHPLNCHTQMQANSAADDP